MGQTVCSRAFAAGLLCLLAIHATGCHTLQKTPATPLPLPLTNTDVISMAANGVSDETIVRSIQTRPNTFDTSPAALIDLKANGVSDRVLQAMQSGPPQPAVLVAEPPPAVVVEPSVHFGVPFFVGRPWHRHHHHRRHHHPRFSFEYSQGW